jgi:hypothetical protein
LSFDGSASFMVITMKEERGFLKTPEAASALCSVHALFLGCV